jgi:hypothetical protein
MGELMQESHAIVASGGGSIESVRKLEDRLKALQYLLKKVLVEGEDYGIIPGTNKNTLYRSGAEKIACVFEFRPSFEYKDLSTSGECHYIVTCTLRGPDGSFVGDAHGEWSSAESNNAWRKANSEEEFEDAPEDERRIVHKKAKGGGTYEVQQIIVSRADAAIKGMAMAEKRAFVRAVRTASCASSIFTSEIEDLPPGMAGNGKPERAPIQRPQAKAATPQAAPSGDGVEITIANVTEEAGTSKSTGKPWKKFTIVAANGDAYKTFDAKIYERAKSMKGTGEIAIIEYKTGQWGHDLTSFTPVTSGGSELFREPGMEG